MIRVRYAEFLHAGKQQVLQKPHTNMMPERFSGTDCGPESSVTWFGITCLSSGQGKQS